MPLTKINEGEIFSSSVKIYGHKLLLTLINYFKLNGRLFLRKYFRDHSFFLRNKWSLRIQISDEGFKQRCPFPYEAPL